VHNRVRTPQRRSRLSNQRSETTASSKARTRISSAESVFYSNPRQAILSIVVKRLIGGGALPLHRSDETRKPEGGLQFANGACWHLTYIMCQEKTPNHRWVCKVVRAQWCLKLFEIDRGPTSWITSIIECFLLHQTLHVALTNQSVDMIVEHSEK
jgi:hypothetical protein